VLAVPASAATPPRVFNCQAVNKDGVACET